MLTVAVRGIERDGVTLFPSRLASIYGRRNNNAVGTDSIGVSKGDWFATIHRSPQCGLPSAISNKRVRKQNSFKNAWQGSESSARSPSAKDILPLPSASIHGLN
jgi:hypothetical protein